MIELLGQLKKFLSEQPVVAFLAISLGVNAVLFRLYVKEKDAHLRTVLDWLPLSEKLTQLLEAAANKARRRSAPVSEESPCPPQNQS